jgi:hypothetical protein
MKTKNTLKPLEKHELLDRTSLLTEMFHDYILGHVNFENASERFKKQANEIGDKFHDLYLLAFEQ